MFQRMLYLKMAIYNKHDTVRPLKHLKFKIDSFVSYFIYINIGDYFSLFNRVIYMLLIHIYINVRVEFIININ